MADSMPDTSAHIQQEEFKMEGHPVIENVFKPGRGHSGGGEGGLASALPLLLAGRADHMGLGAGGFGAGLLGGVLGGLLFSGRRGGLFGGDCDSGGGGDRIAVDAVELQALNSIQAAIPTVALQSQVAFQSAIGQLALGTQQGFSNVKDSVQASTFLLTKELCDINQNVTAQGCQTRDTVQLGVQAILSRIDSNTIAELTARLNRVEGRGHARETEISVSQNVNQVQQQQQQQQQINDRFGRLELLLANIVQVAHATNQNVIAGNTGAVTTGAQTASPTNVNTRS